MNSSGDSRSDDDDLMNPGGRADNRHNCNNRDGDKIATLQT